MAGPEQTEREAVLAQVAAYLEWEQELGGSTLPRLALRQPVAASSALPERAAALRASEPVTPAPPPIRPQQAPASDAQPARASLAALASSLPVNAGEDRRVRLGQLEEQARACTGCELHKGRKQAVFARGNPESKLVFVGEGPGQEEDRSGQPFVGPAGQLLDKMVAAMGLHRDDVYICNVVKCRPPGNRTPLPSEAGACAPFLIGQIDAVAPRVLVALGRCAAENMGLVDAGTWRGRWGRFRGVDVMPTYHPAFLLRSPEYKRPVWEDLQKVMARLRELG